MATDHTTYHHWTALTTAVASGPSSELLEPIARRLEHVVERAMILAHGPTLTLDETLVAAGGGVNSEDRPIGAEMPMTENRTLAEFERDYIVYILERTRWVVEGVNGAARRLGLKPSTLRGRMRRLNIARQPI